MESQEFINVFLPKNLFTVRYLLNDDKKGLKIV